MTNARSICKVLFAFFIGAPLFAFFTVLLVAFFFAPFMSEFDAVLHFDRALRFSYGMLAGWWIAKIV